MTRPETLIATEVGLTSVTMPSEAGAAPNAAALKSASRVASMCRLLTPLTVG